MEDKSSTSLAHYGVLGMRWGIRRNHESGGGRKISADHKAFSEIRKKKLKDMTDDEIRTAVKRLELLKKYKEGRGYRANPFDTKIFDNKYALRKQKNPKEMSNEDLEAGIRRNQLQKEDLKFGVRKMKKISQMTDAEVKAALDRHLLEKSYRDLDKGTLVAVAKFVGFLFGIKNKL